MSEVRNFIVPADAAGQRLDLYLTTVLPEVSRSRIQSIVRSGGVLLNGEAPRTSEKLSENDEIRWEEPDAIPCESARAEEIPLNILAEDKSLVVLNKPAGMVVHPGAGNADGTLVSALLHHCGSLSQIGGVDRPGIVHRLDKETSGCLVVAKTDEVHRALSEQFANREVKKTYLALVAGFPKNPEGIIDVPIARHRVHRQKMAAVINGRGGREAVTEYKVLESGRDISLIECHPHTGRTHQIRVHLKHLGCPVLGDPVYGKRGEFTRHMLHAWKLEFTHPVSRRLRKFEAPIPREFRIA